MTVSKMSWESDLVAEMLLILKNYIRPDYSRLNLRYEISHDLVWSKSVAESFSHAGAAINQLKIGSVEAAIFNPLTAGAAFIRVFIFY